MKKALISTSVVVAWAFSTLAHADVFDALKCLARGCRAGGLPGAVNVLPVWLKQGQIPSQIATSQLPWMQDFAAGQYAKGIKDWSTAKTRTSLALQGMETYGEQHPGHEMLFSVHQRNALTTLVEVAKAQGRPADGLPHLERLMVLEEAELSHRIASGDPGLASMTSGDAMAMLKSVFEVGISSAAHLNRRLLTSDMEGTPLEEALAERLPEAAMTMVTLAETYAELGMREKAWTVFDDPFKRFLLRQNENPNPATHQSLNVVVENACFRMAMALARLGQSSQADEAFACAMQQSSKNYIELGVMNTMGVMQDAAAERRRLVAGAYASYVFSADNPQGLQSLLSLVAETKGASNRYRERRRAIWTHSTDRRFTRARQQFADHERRLTDMPLQGMNTGEALAAWMNEEHRLMSAYVGDFQKAGIQDVFSPGEQILARSRSKLDTKGRAQGGDEVLIGFFVYRPVDFSALQLQPARMLRYVVSNNVAHVQEIGSVAEINRLVRQWRSAAVAGKAAGAGALSERLLGGLPSIARKARSWVIDPDGALSVLPFEALALPWASAGRVIDLLTLRYVTSIAEFADPSESSVPSAVPGGTAVIVADPVFAGYISAGERTLSRELRTTSGELLRNLRLQPLPETREEARQVEAAFSRMGVTSQLHTGAQATPDAFNFSRAPRYLHVATHGIFLEPGVSLAHQGYVRLASALPGLQSALVLSASDMGSILTGADIARLNLLGTELVVFSACDTGNGEIEAGEGVASLRRAIEEAGARSSITSMWPVPSQATARLMADFYARLAAGQSKSEALRQAKLMLMKNSPNPVHWAGFLLAGEP